MAALNGFAEYSSGKETVKCWDNVHWWGSRGADKPINVVHGKRRDYCAAAGVAGVSRVYRLVVSW
jgi:hypothetical protein